MRRQSAASAGEIEGNETTDIQVDDPPDLGEFPDSAEREESPATPAERRVVESATPKRAKVKAESKPPNVDEWQDFFARIVLKSLLEGYTAWLFRDFEEEISPAEWARIKIPKEDILAMAAPFATLANKSAFAGKHGRTIIAATDSYEAIIALGIWMRRVNKIAAKHRKEKAPVVNLVGKGNANGGPDRSNEQPRPGNDDGPTGIRVVNPGSG